MAPIQIHVKEIAMDKPFGKWFSQKDIDEILSQYLCNASGISYIIENEKAPFCS